MLFSDIEKESQDREWKVLTYLQGVREGMEIMVVAGAMLILIFSFVE